MEIKKSVKCPKCGKVVVEDEKQLQHLYLRGDLKCPYCRAVVINASKAVW